ncbi:hypothetical protein QTH89_13800 [Variovorax sp. J22G21]|uniref:DUF4286 family protein n=1 Tax=Variovorax fucosicus TaxID=3053517 RepID=UPI0025763895|nr:MULTISPECIES: DUF4286 family protein [unclassified Variovorax]MDM0037494.1 hypothetical protein [Variovorax sp. J22R193]MDM0062270.1 hypothetical protein [Variovorax sp. J22G21]
MQDLWLLKHGPLAETIDRTSVQAWHALDRSGCYMYMPGDTAAPTLPLGAGAGAGGWQRLRCLQELAGASAGQVALNHYVVETDVLPEFEDDLNAWYAQEHLPGLAAVPGTVRAARYLDAGASPRYYACYDLVDAAILGSPTWLAVRATPWSSRVRPAFRNTRRTMFCRTLPEPPSTAVQALSS